MIQYQVPAEEVVIHNPYKDMIMKTKLDEDMSKYKLNYTKIKTLKDIVDVLKAMDIQVTLKDDDVSDAFQALMNKKMLIKQR